MYELTDASDPSAHLCSGILLVWVVPLFRRNFFPAPSMQLSLWGTKTDKASSGGFCLMSSLLNSRKRPDGVENEEIAPGPSFSQEVVLRPVPGYGVGCPLLTSLLSSFHRY